MSFLQDVTNFSLKKAVAGLEDGIIVLSGPALAISGIIAGVDLVTGGNILKSIWWLSLVWAITLLLTLDFQVLALGVRAHRAYTHAKKEWWQKALEIVLLCLVAAGISFVSIQMQSIIARVNAESVSIDIAAAQLGINMIWLIWERSTLVLVLIFMSGWLREHEEPKNEAPPALDMTSIVNELDARLQHRIEGVYQRIDFKIEQAIGISQELPAVRLLPPGEPVRGFEESITETPGEPVRGFGYGDAIEALVKAEPGITEQAIAERLGCSITTVKKWKKRLEVPGKANDTVV